jgi:hypothetical protein
MGTTMKKAGSKDSFYEVDHDLIFHIAKTGSLQKPQSMIFVSALGADVSP